MFVPKLAMASSNYMHVTVIHCNTEHACIHFFKHFFFRSNIMTKIMSQTLALYHLTQPEAFKGISITQAVC